MMKFSTALQTATVVLAFTAGVQARTWTDVTGQFRFDADLVTVSQDMDSATFLAANGKEYKLPIDALSSKDQKHLLAIARKRQVSRSKGSIRDVPKQILEKIKLAAVEIWPDDEEKQMELTKGAVSKYLASDAKSQGKAGASRDAIPIAIIERVRSQAADIWPEDEVSRQEYTQKQLGYYRILKRYRNPRLPALALVQIKKNAKDHAPDDYEAQLRYVYRQSQAGIAYLAKLESERRSRKQETTTVSVATTERTEPSSLETASESLEHEPAQPAPIEIATQLAGAPLPSAQPALVYPVWQANELCVQTRNSDTLPFRQFRPSKNSEKPNWKWFARTHGN